MLLNLWRERTVHETADVVYADDRMQGRVGRGYVRVNYQIRNRFF